MKRTTFLLLVSLIILNLNGQTAVDHWESVFNSNTEFKYRTSVIGEPPQDWRLPGFNDGSWETGTGGIGYGDNDDGTTIESCIGVFLRKDIVIADHSEIVDAYLFMDYDDAFVAYLNGEEIARSQGLSDPFPAIDELSTAQHEAGTREKFRISSDILNAHLKTGSNTIAIQVHNASATSSDLSSNAWLMVGLSTPGNNYQATPEWFNPPIAFISTNLPLFIIDTENGISIPDGPKVKAYMGIIYNIEGQENYLSDPHNHYSGNIGIERRGNSTQSFPKKPYEFETRNSEGLNLNVSLFGWPSENDYILRASYMDHTFIRNPLAMHMSMEMSRWASRCKLVEVVLNGEYIGIYILMEKIKRDAGRLDIAELLPNEISEPFISGGYIYEISGFNNTIGQSRHLKYPPLESAASEQVQYITQYDNSFRDVMRSANYMDDINGYRAWIDVGSFVDELLVHEAMRNSDAYGWSGYFHKDMGGRIKAGPVWDFDQSAGNSSYPDNGVIENWMFSHPHTSNTPFFWPLLFEDPEFSYLVRFRWELLRENSFQTAVLLDFIDEKASILASAQAREFEKWPVLGANIWRETNGYQDRNTYQKEVDYLKNFLEARWSWMDNELAKYNNPNSIIAKQLNLNDITVYPNPARSYLNFDITQSTTSAVSISIYNHLGALIQSENTTHFNPTDDLIRIELDNPMPPGMYIFEVLYDSGTSHFGKFIKTD